MSLLERFGSTKPEPKLSPELIARLEAIEQRQHLQEKGLKLLELEWQEWYDKFRLMFARLSKRIRDWQAIDDTAEPDTPQSRQDAPRATNRPQVGYGHPPLPVRPGKPNYGG